jgi:hypothetical protein
MKKNASEFLKPIIERPVDTLNVYFDVNRTQRVHVYLGNILNPLQVCREPKIHYDTSDVNQFYTLVIVNIDVRNNFEGTTIHPLHWLCLNTNPHKIYRFATEYVPPKGRRIYPLNRYTVLLYKQQERQSLKIFYDTLDMCVIERSDGQYLNLKKLVNSNNLDLLAANFFCVKNCPLEAYIPLQSDVDGEDGDIEASTTQELCRFVRRRPANNDAAGEDRDVEPSTSQGLGGFIRRRPANKEAKFEDGRKVRKLHQNIRFVQHFGLTMHPTNKNLEVCLFLFEKWIIVEKFL